MCIEKLAKSEATKTIELQQKIDSFEDLLNKQSRVLIATVNRAAQFEFAYEVQINLSLSRQSKFNFM